MVNSGLSSDRAAETQLSNKKSRKVCAASLGFLLWNWKFPKQKINIPVISLLFGMLWAWHRQRDGDNGKQRTEQRQSGRNTIK
jgi:hypothetical protein